MKFSPSLPYIATSPPRLPLKAVLMAQSGGAGGAKFQIADVPTPSPGEGEIVVDLRACGLCGTDLEKMKGEYTAAMPILGHEAVGVVSSVGAGVRDFAVGDRVFPHHHVPCGGCYYCRSGSQTMCERYRSSNLHPGGFSESFLVPRWNIDKGGVLKIPDALGFEAASMIEPVSCCVRAIDRVSPDAGSTALVSGAGPVGLAHAIILRSIGVEVAVSDVSEKRLAFAKGIGIREAIDARSKTYVSDVRSFAGGRGVDLVIVASGSPQAIIQALKSVRKGGTVCLFGIPAKGSVLDYDIADVYNSEISIVTTYGGTDVETVKALEMMVSGKTDFTPLVSHRVPLDKFGEAVDVALRGEGMKVLITP